jgi:hypothetical protein
MNHGSWINIRSKQDGSALHDQQLNPRVYSSHSICLSAARSTIELLRKLNNYSPRNSLIWFVLTLLLEFCHLKSHISDLISLPPPLLKGKILICLQGCPILPSECLPPFVRQFALKSARLIYSKRSQIDGTCYLLSYPVGGSLEPTQHSGIYRDVLSAL